MIEPAWLTALIDQRMALVEDKVAGKVDADYLITTPLVEYGPDTRPGFDRWDKTCDNPGCHRYCPTTLFSGHIVRNLKQGNQVVMIFGVCPRCKTQLES